MPLRGTDKHLKRLRRLASQETQRRIGQALFVGAQTIAVEAQLSITNGAISGPNHVASEPGEPPSNNSGVLAGNIEAISISNELAEVSSNADPYAAMLEFGTSKMAERPYMRPAKDRKRKEVVALVQRAINRQNRP